jgi:hypothetical protein
MGKSAKAARMPGLKQTKGQGVKVQSKAIEKKPQRKPQPKTPAAAANSVEARVAAVRAEASSGKSGKKKKSP